MKYVRIGIKMKSKLLRNILVACFLILIVGCSTKPEAVKSDYQIDYLFLSNHLLSYKIQNEKEEALEEVVLEFYSQKGQDSEKELIYSETVSFKSKEIKYFDKEIDVKEEYLGKGITEFIIKDQYGERIYLAGEDFEEFKLK